MKKIKYYLKSLVYFYLILLSYLILATTFSYFELLSFKVISVVSFIFMILLFMFIGFYIASKSEKKGYINGLIIGGFNIVLFLFIALIIGENPELTIGIYFLILILSSTIGGMFGINYQNKNKISWSCYFINLLSKMLSSTNNISSLSAIL